MFQRQFDVTKEDLRSLNPSASANLLWGLVKTGAAFADGFDRECLGVVAADLGPKLLSFSPRVRKGGRGAGGDARVLVSREGIFFITKYLFTLLAPNVQCE